MFCAIILAAGAGTRLNNTKKQFLKINQKMLIEHSVNAFLNANASEIVIATNVEKLCFLKQFFKRNNKIKIVAGGKTRQQSAKNAFLACNKTNKLILIHDAARPFINPNSIKKLVKVALKTKAATLASFATDTIKIVENQKVHSTLDRNKIAIIQTPQAFATEIYSKALQFAKEHNLDFTDDCQLVEKLGIPVFVVENSKLNFKITTNLDLKIAKLIAKTVKNKGSLNS